MTKIAVGLDSPPQDVLKVPAIETLAPGSLGHLDDGLKREINQLGFAAITLNGVIGGGLFALPALAAAKVGLFSPWLFLLCGTLFMTIVLSFARLSRLFSQTGGPSVYVSESFGPMLGFQTGWLLYLGRVTAMAANANLMAIYLSWFFPALDSMLLRSVVITLIIGSLTVVNFIGIRQGINTILVLTVLKLLPLALLIGVGLPQLSLAIGAADLPSSPVLGEAVLVLFYAFVGFEGGAINAGEGHRPRHDIPRALIKTVLFTAFLYFLIQWLAISVLPDLGKSKQPLADVANILMGNWGAGLIVFAAVVSIFGNLSSVMLAAPRMTFALARDGGLPHWFAAINPRFATPANSILVVGLFSLALALSNTFVYLAIMSTLVRLVGYTLCIASLPILERRAGRWPSGLAAFRAAAMPLAACLLCLILMTFASWQAWLTLLAFSAGGSIFYVLARRTELASSVQAHRKSRH
ncbi:APC family permease [Undibacterium sp.]|uniref:APC family permease n=1 Tax=Undibacterium sp. TaxID=1914977 RepID=UPI003753A8F9